MTRIGFAILIGAVFAAEALAQSEPTTVTLASGTALNAELISSVDSKKVKAGDTVEAHTTVDLRNDGRMVIPRGTKLVGHVTEASARAKGDSESALAIQFDKVIAKNGAEISLTAEIRAIAAPVSDFSPSEGPGRDPMADRGAAAAGGSPMGASRSQAPPTAPPAGGIKNTAGGGPRELPANSRGVLGLSGLKLSTDASSASQGAVITSTGKSVHLDSGTRLLLISRAGATAEPGK